MDVVVAPAQAGRIFTAARRLLPALLGLLIGLGLGLLLAQRLADELTPSNAVLGWYAALRRGDAVAAWNAGHYGHGALLTEQALAAMLAQAPNRDYSQVRVLSATPAGPGRYLVDVVYRHDGEPVNATLSVYRDGSRRYLLIPHWRVEVTPARLSVTGFAPGSRLSLDGLRVDTAEAESGLLVIPGLHLLAETATSIANAQSMPVDVLDSTAGTLHPVITRVVREEASAQLEDAFAGCERSADLRPAGCPISTYRMGDVISGVSWSAIGDQLKGAVFAPGAAPDLVSVTGTWRMHVAYDFAYLGLEEFPEHREVDETGGWRAVFRRTPAGLQLVSFDGA